MNMQEAYRQELKSKLLSLNNTKSESGGRYIVTRCPFCNDSIKHRNKGHFYIYVGFKDKEVPYYKCFRQQCQVKGVVNEHVMKELGIMDVSLLNLHREFFKNKDYNNIILGNVNKYNKVHFKKKNIKILSPLNNEYTQQKIEYLNNRMGIEFGVKELIYYKIILNFYDFLKYNKVERTFNKNYKLLADAFDKQYIGFLSADNFYLTLRNIGKVSDNFMRYQNFNIFNIDSTEIDKTYIISNKVNIFNKPKIVMAEGIFDIIGIHNHIYNKETDNIIYTAICGSNYETVIKKFLRMGLIHSDIEIYSDKEVEIEYYRQLKKNLSENNLMKNNMVVYYNKIAKDYGETKDKIKLFKFNI